MKIASIYISILTNKEDGYTDEQVCQCCTSKISPTRQPNGVDYYYLVAAEQNDSGRAIDPACLGTWLGKIGSMIAGDPQPYWQHAMLNRDEHAVSMGRRGGTTKTAAKATAARENGKKGGRPKKKAGD